MTLPQQAQNHASCLGAEGSQSVLPHPPPPTPRGCACRANDPSDRPGFVEIVSRLR